MLARSSMGEARAARAGEIVVMYRVKDGYAELGGDPPDRGGQSRQVVGMDDVRLEGVDPLRDRRRQDLPVLDPMPQAAQRDILRLVERPIDVLHCRGMDIDAVVRL